MKRRTRGTNEPNLFKTLRTRFGLSCENPFDSSFLKTFPIPVFLSGYHMGENLKIEFQPDLHPK